MKSLYPAPPAPASSLSLSGEAADMEAVWMTRFTVLDSSHCRRITRTAATAASAVLLYCRTARTINQDPLIPLQIQVGISVWDEGGMDLTEVRCGILHLGAGGGFEPVWRGDEEDEPAPSDRRREGGGVEEVGLEQPQPLRRARGDQPPQQPGLLLVLCGARSPK